MSNFNREQLELILDYCSEKKEELNALIRRFECVFKANGEAILEVDE